MARPRDQRHIAALLLSLLLLVATVAMTAAVSAQVPDPDPKPPPREFTTVTLALEPELPLAEVSPSNYAGAVINITFDVASLPAVVTTISVNLSLETPGDEPNWQIVQTVPDTDTDPSTETLVVTGSDVAVLEVTVMPPIEAELQDVSLLNVTGAWSTSIGENGQVGDDATIGIAQYYGMSAFVTKPLLTLKPGDQKELTLRVNNIGNGVDSFRVGVEGVDLVTSAAGKEKLEAQQLSAMQASGWVVQLNQTTFSLQDRGQAKVTIAIGTPSEGSLGQYRFYLNVSSEKTRDTESPEYRVVPINVKVVKTTGGGGSNGDGNGSKDDAPANPLPGFEGIAALAALTIGLVLVHRRASQARRGR